MYLMKPRSVKDGPVPLRVGLGGEGVLRTHGREDAAGAVIREALTRGITYFDSAPAYAGCQSYYGRVWRESPDDRAAVFLAGKSAGRRYDQAMADLENTLAVMGVDHLDLWQIHDLRTPDEFNMIGGPGGALEAFVRAREDGIIRYIGVTGHHDPGVLTRAVQEWPVDAVLLPVNPVETCIGGFLDLTLPAARERGIAVIAMKVLGGGHYVTPDAGVTARELTRFALAQPVTMAIVGCSTPAEVGELAECGRMEGMMSEEDQNHLVELFRPHARRLAFYRGRF